MCVKDSEAFLPAAIESILTQTYEDFEFIIVENGSKDRSWEIINSYEDSRIRPFQTPIAQLPFNLNFGIMHSKGQYIARMDSDDISMPGRLAKQATFLDDNSKTAVIGTGFTIFGEGISDRTINVPVTDERIRRLLPFRFVLCHPTTVVRRDVLIQYRGYEHVRFCEDLDLWLRISRTNEWKFANLDESLLRYRVHPKQSKGSSEAYYSSVSILLKEGLIQRRPSLYLAAIGKIAASIARLRQF